jgi:hypothetical protein
LGAGLVHFFGEVCEEYEAFMVVYGLLDLNGLGRREVYLRIVGLL